MGGSNENFSKSSSGNWLCGPGRGYRHGQSNPRRDFAAHAQAFTTAYLTDALGRRVFTTTVQPANGSLHLTVPATIAPGSYTLVVVSQAGRQTNRRVTKE